MEIIIMEKLGYAVIFHALGFVFCLESTGGAEIRTMAEISIDLFVHYVG